MALADLEQPVLTPSVLEQLVVQGYEGDTVISASAPTAHGGVGNAEDTDRTAAAAAEGGGGRGWDGSAFHGHGVLTFREGHVYEGDFRNGRLEGKGKMTWADGTTYEGDFQGSCITGTGVYSWPDGSRYEGQVLHGRRHGRGRMVLAPKMAEYDGEWQHGMRHGQGTLCWKAKAAAADDGLQQQPIELSDEEADNDSEWTVVASYSGQWHDDKKHGLGNIKYDNGDTFHGAWDSDRKCGQGTYRWKSLGQAYKGEWLADAPSGDGYHVWQLATDHSPGFPLCNFYIGDFEAGLRHGRGTFHFSTGGCFQGRWHKGLKHDVGTYTSEDGSQSVCHFENDRLKDTMGGSPPQPESMVYKVDEAEFLTDETDPEKSKRELERLLLRHNIYLKALYDEYSTLETNGKFGSSLVLRLRGFWRLARERRLASVDFTLDDLNRYVHMSVRKGDRHLIWACDDPAKQILFREFIESIIRIANHYYSHFPRLALRVDALITWIQDLKPGEIDPFWGDFYSDSIQSLFESHTDVLNQLYDDLADDAEGRVTCGALIKYFEKRNALGTQHSPCRPASDPDLASSPTTSSFSQKSEVSADPVTAESTTMSMDDKQFILNLEDILGHICEVDVATVCVKVWAMNISRNRLEFEENIARVAAAIAKKFEYSVQTKDTLYTLLEWLLGKNDNWTTMWSTMNKESASPAVQEDA